MNVLYRKISKINDFSCIAKYTFSLFLRLYYYMKQIIKYLSIILIILSGCTKDDLVSPYPQFSDQVPSDALTITDPAGDLALAAEGPPSVIPFSPVDIRTVRLWKADGYLYIRADFEGEIPGEKPNVMGETVNQQGLNVSIDTDNNRNTGAGIGSIGGVDIFFALLIRYSQPPTAPYANFNFQTTDVHSSTGHIEGEFRGGGPGNKFAVYRFSLSTIGSLFPSTGSATLGGWCEAESGSYHHFAFDEFNTVTWILP